MTDTNKLAHIETVRPTPFLFFSLKVFTALLYPLVAVLVAGHTVARFFRRLRNGSGPASH